VSVVDFPRLNIPLKEVSLFYVDKGSLTPDLKSKNAGENATSSTKTLSEPTSYIKDTLDRLDFSFVETVDGELVPSFLDESDVIDVDNLSVPRTPSPFSARKNLTTHQKKRSGLQASAAKPKHEFSENKREALPANVVRLFERTLCVDGFTEESALDPMCRGWVWNQQYPESSKS
jgi:hypothetical protein